MIFSFGDYKINTDNIICILDIDSVTVTKRGKILFDEKSGDKVLVTDEKNLPLSAVVCREKDENRIYLTSFTPQTLLRHLGAEKSNESDDMLIWW